MNLNVIINLDDTYDIEDISPDFDKFQFTSVCKQKGGDDYQVTLHVQIENRRNVFLPGVFNLAFGPLNEDGTINDTISLRHQNNSKVYSTILLGAVAFLRNKNEPNTYVGVDGSDITRAYLYYKLLQTNYDYLVQYVEMIGVKYFVRLLRGKNTADALMPDTEDLAIQPFKILKGQQMNCTKLYNYFMFKNIVQ